MQSIVVIVFLLAAIILLCIGSGSLVRREGFSKKGPCVRHTYLDMLDSCRKDCNFDACISMMNFDNNMHKLGFDTQKLRNFMLKNRCNKNGCDQHIIHNWIVNPSKRKDIKKLKEYKNAPK